MNTLCQTQNLCLINYSAGIYSVVGTVEFLLIVTPEKQYKGHFVGPNEKSIYIVYYIVY